MNLPIQVAERLAWLNAKIAEKKANKRLAPTLPPLSKIARGVSRAAWTVEERREAVKLKRDGWTCLQIGKKLGRTKNSVIGQLYDIRGHPEMLRRAK